MRLDAPSPARGWYQSEYEPLARAFAESLPAAEVGAAVSVYQGSECVVRLYGGYADRRRRTPWQEDTRIVVFSASKGLTAMAFHLAAADGLFDWDQRVAEHWPGFAENGKDAITIRQLLNHQAGLSALEGPTLRLEDCLKPSLRVRRLLESQRPGEAKQAYHAITWGLYAAELFAAITGENVGPFLRRRVFEPLGSDARLGDGPEHDERTATLYGVNIAARAAFMAQAAALNPLSAEAGILRDMTRRNSLSRAAFANPAAGSTGPLVYNERAVRRASLPWASATASAEGLARAYIPFANGGEAFGRRFFSAASLAPLERRQSWSFRDGVLQKPVGWSQGFLKEERHLFSPNPGSFGHAGMGGSLGWADPATGLAFGYVMNRMDWRVRSVRCLALCRALYECEGVLRA
ncbi:MAG: serine hydrolase domain-containing protein [Myxococcota bacterium]